MNISNFNAHVFNLPKIPNQQEPEQPTASKLPENPWIAAERELAESNLSGNADRGVDQSGQSQDKIPHQKLEGLTTSKLPENPWIAAERKWFESNFPGNAGQGVDQSRQPEGKFSHPEFEGLPLSK
ncbi:hypothetical protein [Pseudomonas sp. Marseille-Q1929]|uniref:hypothetical protein n=1 Tax=Pseudomonas sp. Marseille-Q1929 TaxID=2730402 RepID=UPI001A8FE027|nr:hypothetical protein [Pseudomonas sp. Marseille-Q1929]MBO0493678.1 hypothetical protein [Pseudomonas sp. Marseille-Q1929]